MPSTGTGRSSMRMPPPGRALGLHPNELIGRSADSLADGCLRSGVPGALAAARVPGGLRGAAAGATLRPARQGQLLAADRRGVASVRHRAAWSRHAGATAPPMAGTGVFTATDVWARSLRDDRTDAATGHPRPERAAGGPAAGLVRGPPRADSA